MKLAAAIFCFLLPGAALAQTVPSGQPVLNQGFQARAVTPSDSATITATRGLFIGDASACNIAVRFNGDSATVTLTNVQAGQILPFSVIQVLSTGTTCSAAFAIY